MKKRTIREFTYSSDIWPLVDSWAAEEDFTLESNDGSLRVYNKGRWLVLAPTHFEISQVGSKVVLQTWLKANFYMTLTLFTGKPPEGGLESGGLSAWVQRKKARASVNRLLESLGEKPIK